VLALAGLVAVLCSLEVLVRFLIMGPGTLFTADADIGKVPIKGTHVLWGTEGYGRTTYVGDGEIASPSDTGAVIVVLGDSHTEALQVDDATKFVSVAESELRRRGRLFNLRNLGFSGGTMADYVRVGPSVMSRYHPALVVIQLSSADFGPETFDPSHVNHFAREANGSLRLVHLDMRVGSPSLGARIKNASALINYGQLRYLRIAERRAHTAGPHGGVDTAPADTIRWDTVPTQLELLHSAYPDVPVILLLLPFVPRLEARAIMTDDPEYERTVETVRRSIRDFPGWQVIDPLPAFRSLAGRGVLPRGFSNTRPGLGHLNEIGHRIVAERLADTIDKARP